MIFNKRLYITINTNKSMSWGNEKKKKKTNRWEPIKKKKKKSSKNTVGMIN